MSLHQKSLRPVDRRGRVAAGPLVRIRDGRTHWCVRQDWRERLLGPGSPDWFGLDGDSCAEPVKRGRGRAIWRVRLDETTVFAKLLGAGNFLERIKSRMLGSAAEREWRAAREAERRGVAAVRGLGSGSRSDLDRSGAFLSEGLDEVTTLAELWARQVAGATGRERHHRALQVIEAVAAMSAEAHEAGFVHRDGHPSNILVRRSSGGRMESFYADLHGAHFSRGRASTRRAVYSLVQLNHYFKRFASRAERLRFLSGYLTTRFAFGAPDERRRVVREWVRSVLKGAPVHAERLARQRDRRLFRDDKYFARIALDDGWTATAALTLARRHVFPEKEIPDRSAAEWQSLVEAAVSAVRAGAPMERLLKGAGMRVETARPGGMVRSVAWALWGSPHRRTFLRSHRLRHRDVHEPLILGFAEHRRGLFVDQSMLLRPGADDGDR